MARQRVHNRRAGRGGGGSAWISYSDIMAALVMMFVLFLVYSLYNYSRTIQLQVDALNEQQVTLDAQADELARREGIIIVMQSELDSTSLALSQREEELSAQTIILIGKQEELDDAKATLAVQETEITRLNLDLATRERQVAEQQDQLNAQAAALARQAEQINTMVGVRSEIVQELSGAMRASDLDVTVDSSGNIVLEAAVLFQSGSYQIAPEGEAMLKQFLPIYLRVLMQPEYSDYLGEIIIEGHTDSDGNYDTNMALSLNRARAVADYCLSIVDYRYRSQLQRLLTVQGRSESDLIYVNGVEDKEASRRVVFKFSLRDEEMVEQLNQILQQTYGTTN